MLFLMLALFSSPNYHDYAVAHNERQYAEAHQRHLRYLDDRGPLRTMTVLDGTGSQDVSIWLDWIPIRERSWSTNSVRFYDRTFRDLNDNGGGPIILLNPFCKP